MICQKCGNEMWDNRINKRNPKAPDYKCKNPECGNAIWIPKPKQQPAPKPTSGGNQYSSAKAMIMAYAKDLVVARMVSGNETLEHPTKSTIQTFRLLWREYEQPLSVQFKEDVQAVLEGNPLPPEGPIEEI